MGKMLYLQLIALFVVTQVLGLYVGHALLKENIAATIVTENKEDLENSVGLFAYILVFTAILLAVIKFAPEWVKFLIFKIFETMAIFFSSVIVLAAFVTPDIIFIQIGTEPLTYAMKKQIAASIPFLISIIIVIAKNVWNSNIALRNLTAIISTAGAGALLGASLGIMPVVLFMVMLSIYDFVAVFKTKHMVTLAKSITNKNLSFTFAIPTKAHTFELGTGDIVLPLTFAVSILAITAAKLPYPYYWVQPGIILFASLLGLIVTINYSSRNVGRALPALPLQSILMIVAYALTVFAGY